MTRCKFSDLRAGRAWLNTAQRVTYLTVLRQIVSLRMNKAGVAIASDFDLIDAKYEEHEEALKKAT